MIIQPVKIGRYYSLKISTLYYFNCISMVGQAHEGVDGACVKFDWHFVDRHVVILRCLLIESDGRVVVIDVDCDSIALHEGPTLDKSRFTTRSLEPTLFWLNWVSW